MDDGHEEDSEAFTEALIGVLSIRGGSEPRTEPGEAELTVFYERYSPNQIS